MIETNNVSNPDSNMTFISQENIPTSCQTGLEDNYDPPRVTGKTIV